MLAFNLRCQLALSISDNMLGKSRPNVKFPLYLKKAGLASRNIVHRQKTFYTVSVSVDYLFLSAVTLSRQQHDILEFSNCPLSRVLHVTLTNWQGFGFEFHLMSSPS